MGDRSTTTARRLLYATVAALVVVGALLVVFRAVPGSEVMRPAGGERLLEICTLIGVGVLAWGARVLAVEAASAHLHGSWRFAASE